MSEGIGRLPDGERATVRLTRSPVPIEISSCTDRIVRLRFGFDDDRLSFLPERTWPDPPLLRIKDQTVALADITLSLDREVGELEFRDGRGSPCLRFALTDLATSAGLRVSCHVMGEQHFFGLGYGGASFDRLGATRRLWTSHINHGNGADIPVPVLLSHRGYGLFFDNAAHATVAPDRSYRTSWMNYETSARSIDVYLLVGASLRETMSLLGDLLGRPTLPPRWLLGFLQSTRHFGSAAEVDQLARDLRSRRLPCDGLIFLSTYGNEKGWNRGVGHLEWQPELFPDPAGAVQSLHDKGFKVLLHEYPVVHPDSPLHAEGLAARFLLDETYPAPAPGTAAPDNYREGQNYIDFANRAAADWWWKQHRHLTALEIDGWWLDGGEGPCAHAEGDGGVPIGSHNRFDLFRQQAFCDGEGRDRPERRPVMLCRSGGAGMQRFGAACWSGDINGSFETLERQVPLALSAAMSGLAYWGSDIGGFYTRRPDEEELFIRWFQFGAFCPIFRAHGRDWRNRLPWSHGERAEAICRNYLELRYRLMPYNYTLAWQAHMSGLPLMRPLVLNYPDDPRAWEISSEFLWGDDLLIAPVTQEAATRRSVYLPEGTWYDFWNGDSFRGNRAIEADAPLERLPIFVREGAIIPMDAVRQHAAAALTDDLTLLVYPSESSSFTLYEDDGDGTAHARGRHLLTTFSARRTGRGLTVAIDETEGDTTLRPPERRYTLRVRLDDDPERVQISRDENGELRDAPWERTGRFVQLSMPASFSRVRFTL